MKKVIIYLRTSSDRQLDNTSLSTQEDICRNYCRTEGFEVVECSVNEAVSAKETNEKRVIELLDFAKEMQGKFEVLVVYKLDRFARSQEQHHWLRGQLLKLSIVLRSASERIDETPSGKLVEGVMAAVNEYDNAIRRERSIIGVWKRISDGLWPKQPPTGYWRPKVPGVRLSLCEWDENCYQAIIDIFTFFNTGAYTQDQLAKLMAEKKLKDYKSVTLKFSKQYISKILKNPFYAGLMVNQEGNFVQGKHKPLITIATWEKTQDLLKSKSNNATHKRLYNHPDFTLRRFTKCSFCDKPFTGCWSSGNGGKYAHYYCANPKCERYCQTIPKKELEEKFCDYLKKIKPKEEFIVFFEKVFITRYEERIHEIKGDYLRKMDDIKELEKEQAWLIEKGQKGVIPDDLLEKQLKDLEQKITLSKFSLTDMHAEEVSIDSLLSYAYAFIRTADLVWYDSLSDARLKYQRLIFPDGVSFDGREFSNQRLALPFNLITDIAAKKSTVVRTRGLEPPTLAGYAPQAYAYTKFRHVRAVPKRGFEPPRANAHSALNAARLPVPPLRRLRLILA
ncbi:MAG: Site-specific recombinase [Candidatus Curtissbacteria bacterium GW2011_GWC2_38_9]|uniref:Site-specific recombinase n=2 Tax=Candidatus Curtissiibacteriota TaxID=1752717 RepID=A0A0G0NTQ8_9BACT|nr:MAG: Site-specific recombinase [Candidatus Curtissbacteria bacterium GW2011_GWC2_38_9]KKS03264.1 MAG: Site-specific recombinase [Candidatus Curtissbacteria bacterium GW2011_GWA2_41_24]